MRATRKIAGAAAVAALALLAAACTGSGSGTSGPGTADASPAAAARPTASATASGPRVAITPGNGAAGVNPSEGITVTSIDWIAPTLEDVFISSVTATEG